MDQNLYEAKKAAYKGKREHRISRYKEKADKASKESEAAYNGAFDLLKDIPPGQPILVGHHSEKHHRRTLSRHDQKMRKGSELEKKAAYYVDKAEATECNQAISSDDPDAIEKLKAKVANLEKKHDFHLRCNREWKKYKTAESKGNKYSMQLTDEEKEKMLADIKSNPAYETQPYPSFTLTNATSKIRSTKLRIKKLEEHNKRNTANYSYSPEGLPEITVIRDVVENRLKIVPPAKAKSFALGLPTIFKQHGFVWSRTNGAYQRKLSSSAHVEQLIIEALKEAYRKEGQ